MHHRKQANGWGCAYHAAYAILGIEKLLDHVDDQSTERFWCRLLEHGYILDMCYGNAFTQEPGDPSMWDALAGLCETDDEHVSVLASYRMKNTQLHMVGVCLSRTAVWVSDSLTDGIQSFWAGDFKNSRYGRPSFIWSFHSALLDDHAPELVSENPTFATNSDNPFYQQPSAT